MSTVDTRKVILEKGQKPSKDIYYVPGFFRLKVKNFTQMNLDNLDAQMNATIIFSVYYGPLQDQIVNQLLNNIILLFGRDDAIKLTQQNNLQTKISKKHDKREIQFTIRKLFHLRIESQVFWSPFEIINLILSVTIQPVVTKLGTIKINLLDHDDNFLKLSYTQEGTFGNYDLAQKKMRTQYTNDRVCKLELMDRPKQDRIREYQRQIDNKLIKDQTSQKKDKKIDHFQYVHFNVPLYKFPIVALATIFLPLWLLAIINLGIFFQDNNLADRIASIAALMIAFVALIPTIRDQIPPNPRIVFIQILVYFETLTSLFALIHSVDVRNTQNFDLVWYESGLFMASLIITILTIVIVLVMMILHYFKWQPSYNKDIKEQKDAKFQRIQWVNAFCDKYFSYIKNRGNNFIEQLADPPLQNQKKNG